MLTADLDYSRRLGCEYEMTFPLVGQRNSTGMDVQNTIRDVLNANNLRACARGYSHDVLSPDVDLAVETDGSVRGETEWHGVIWHPVELKTRILTLSDWERIVPKALEICTYLGARVNVSCGHHVHLSFPEFKQSPRVLRSLYGLVLRYQNVLYGLVSGSRLTNGYCRPLEFRPSLFDGLRTVGDYCSTIRGTFERRDGLNLTHLEETDPHLEFRQAGATTNVEKARHWLRFLLQFVRHSTTRACQMPKEPVANSREGIENLLVCCGFKPNSGIYSKVSPELRETGRWLLKRWKHFNGNFPLKPKSVDGAKKKTETEGDE